MAFIKNLENKKLIQRYGVIPFSVIQKSKAWQTRSYEWIDLGIKGELGRNLKDSFFNFSKTGAYKKWNYQTGKGMSRGSGSIFDPFLCELLYTWFCPESGVILDPFAGGSVRGIVAKKLGYKYYGIELREEQVKSNYEQVYKIFGNTVNNPDELTPIEKRKNIYIKRDDLFVVCGVSGGKARSCYYLIKTAKEKGYKCVTTAGSRLSPQILLVASIARYFGLKAVCHMPSGKLKETSPVYMASRFENVEIIQHKAGYNNVIIKRAKDYAKENNAFYIPFGMECKEAVEKTAEQVKNIPENIERIVVPVGSGMSLAGILHGLKKYKMNKKVLGIIVGADPFKRLDKYAPRGWRGMVKFVECEEDYHSSVVEYIDGLKLDPIYEAKCKKYLREGDLFWIVGNREIQTGKIRWLKWVIGDSNEKLKVAPEADFLFSCPPYGNLEVYSDLKEDISNMKWNNFLKVYYEIIKKAVDKLKQDSFACFVVGNFRDKKTGYIRDLVGETVRAFENAGAFYYNEIIYKTPVGAACLKTKQFDISKKVVKIHQNILIFCKGDWKKAVKKLEDFENGKKDKKES